MILPSRVGKGVLTVSFMKKKGARRGGAKTKGGKGKKEKGRAVGSGGGVRVAGNRDTLPPSPVQAVPTGRDHRSFMCGGPSCPFPWVLDAAMGWWS